MAFYTETIHIPASRPSLFKKFLTKVNNAIAITSYARAARELTRLGYHREAKNCIMEIQKLK